MSQPSYTHESLAYGHGILIVDGWRVPVDILKERRSFGRLDYCVVQSDGAGSNVSRWVAAERVVVTHKGTG